MDALIDKLQANEDALQRLLVRHEGLRLKPYIDSVGKLTIGIGRNLDDVGISEREAFGLLSNDITRVRGELDAALPWWRDLDVVRKHVVIDMAFNLGAERLGTFKLMLAALRTGAFAEASHEMIHSRWAGQVGRRADELGYMMRTGAVPVPTPGLKT